ncbi:unnamed protein product [Heligmosomoides polygyrus]|uniref:Glucuronosyltransferase n=1 Tax=Heligmosomoides polygyrus TaxID=6339 RepID=A0A183FS86_HELPZ|nr:unnamed protein product [Heligmosomoides polygyrus]
MRALQTPFLIAAVFDVCVCYKFLIYSPFLGHSHVKFLGTIADVLTEGGHNVYLILLKEHLTGKLKRSLLTQLGIHRQEDHGGNDLDIKCTVFLSESENGVVKDS